MGERLYSFYIKASENGGIKAKTLLSIYAHMTSVEAKNKPDNEEDIAKVESAYERVMRIKDQLKSLDTNKGIVGHSTEDFSLNSLKQVRLQLKLIEEFTSQRHVIQKDDSVSLRVTEMLCEALDVERASVWGFNEDYSGIVCMDLYERSKRLHSNGVKFNKADYPDYFSAMATERTIAATDAFTHPATQAFSEVYLAPLGIGALLDVPVWVDGKLYGVLCNEHVGGARLWTEDDETFGYLMGNMLAIYLERDSH